jgi:O-antigen/teichoic acid export membrane protein
VVNRLLGRLRRGSGANWTLADQILVSGANFITTVIAARWLGIEAFGWFAFCLIQLLILRSLQTALIISPMLSIGPKFEGNHQRPYFTAVLVQQLILAGTLSAIVLAVGWGAGLFLDSWAAQQATLPLALLALTDQMQEFCRRGFYAMRRQRVAFLTDTLTYGGRMIGLWIWLHALHRDGASDALWVMTGTNALAPVLGFLVLYRWEWDSAVFKQVLRRHWHFSKWLGAGFLVEAIASNVFYLVAGAVLGVAALGIMRASQNVLGAANVLLQALANLIPVEASRTYSMGGRPALMRYTARALAISVGGTLVVALVASAAPEFWLTLLYGDKIAGYGFMIYWQSAVVLATATALPLRAAFQTMENTRPLFFSKLAQEGFAVSSAYALAAWFGLNGTMLGQVVALTIPVVVLIWMLRRGRENSPVSNMGDERECAVRTGGV